MKKVILFSMGIIVGAAWSGSTFATENANTTQMSNRMRNKLGFYLGYSDPAPSILGLNVAYNPYDFLRVSAGYGKVSVTSGLSISSSGISTTEATATTWGVGAVALVPGWSLTPTAGLHFANISYSGEGAISVGGFMESGNHVYGSLGLDYQGRSGFHFGAGLAQSFRSGIGSSFYLSTGWFFDWLS